MKISVCKQIQPRETRVPLTCSVVQKLTGQGFQVLVEQGAGIGAHQSDAEYLEAGAQLVDWAELAQAEVVLSIQEPAASQIAALRQGTVLVAMLAPLFHLETVQTLAERGVTTFSMEFIPRISRAQPMDVLSSQANIAGYKAVLLAADSSAKIYPMMMTAAGTIAPSKVFVIGAGVAGLQAIATAKRLGAVVEAFDVRPVVKEQVLSLGARFVELPMESGDTQTAGGYARQLTDAERGRQTELMARHVIGADVVITTASVFGKAPPMLIPEEVVSQMHAGAVIVDTAVTAEIGRGNCALTQPDQRYETDNGVMIIGETNLPALVPVHASQAYANNLHSFLREITADGQLQLNFEDEIQKGALITQGGQVVNEMVMQAMSN